MRLALVTSLALALCTLLGCATPSTRSTGDGGRDAVTPEGDAGVGDAGVGDDGAADLDAADLDAADLDAGPLPYPERDPMRLKELQPDFWPMDEIAGNNTGGVAMNLVWASWEPSEHLAPCDAGQVLYDGHCFVVDTAVDDAIAGWSARGLAVTAVTYGVPAWAHVGNTSCSPAAAGFEIFCAPDDAADYARFAGMITSSRPIPRARARRWSLASAGRCPDRARPRDPDHGYARARGWR